MNHWKFASDKDTVVFYNAAADIYLELCHKFYIDFSFCLDKSMNCRKVSCNLSCSDRSSAVNESLLSLLKSGKGTPADKSNHFGIWSLDFDGSNIVFTIKRRPHEKLVLVDDGFFYFVSDDALVAHHDSESYMSATCAMKILESLKKTAAVEPLPVKARTSFGTTFDPILIWSSCRTYLICWILSASKENPRKRRSIPSASTSSPWRI